MQRPAADTAIVREEEGEKDAGGCADGCGSNARNCDSAVTREDPPPLSFNCSRIHGSWESRQRGRGGISRAAAAVQYSSELVDVPWADRRVVDHLGNVGRPDAFGAGKDRSNVHLLITEQGVGYRLLAAPETRNNMT